MSQKSDITKMTNLILTGNNLTNSSISSLLDHPFSSLEELQLNKNRLLVGEALKGMANKTYTNLTILDLSETSIGDQGIEYLSQARFPKLVTLMLKDVDMTEKGIEYLSTVDFP